MLGDVRQALLGDAVDHQLLLGGEPGDGPARVEGGADARLIAEVADLALEGREQTVVVEHRGAEVAGEREELLLRLRREALGLREVPAQLRRGVLDRRLQA